ncbi:HNH endonuclease signature motif containing protein [Streptomyces sp. NBC_01373]|uniref:HNH endonuclease signature motif containing protein n=1 Tax=Streptomyces sp. NBC_01373 TaxID=2903843 RepID=UPI00225863FF|nr:HNH endonuclease signature motif containing protein [Streptomyces sp. NBC_01373]MCX4704391.1 HNH endonuclease [Streptomyces sp. NBC_01373]MCX4707131.1 HNH endonuclease [Streptomyces sp. NBC_01373]
MTEAIDNCIECGRSRTEEIRQSLTRGRCRNCYQRHVYALKKAASFEAIKPASALERLFSRAVPGRNGCIIWTGTMNPKNGYGQISDGGKIIYTHRAAYVLAKGDIPDGLVIDHACHNRDPNCHGGNCIHHLCINPHHLEAVTQRENRIRSPHTKTSGNGQKTHCKQGHEFTPENTRVVRRTGARVCITCHRRRQNEFSARRRAAAQQAA